MYNINNLLLIDYKGYQLKFESLILFKHFLKIHKEEKFIKLTENLSNKILLYFDKFYKENKINKIDDGLKIHILYDEFINQLYNEFNKELTDFHIYFNEIQDNSVKTINLIEMDFKKEIINVFFKKILNLRIKFFN